LREHCELLGKRSKLELHEEVAQHLVVRLPDLECLEIQLDVEVGHDRDQPLGEANGLRVFLQRLGRARRLETFRVHDQRLDVAVLLQ
jgi:hypothetical protein